MTSSMNVSFLESTSREQVYTLYDMHKYCIKMIMHFFHTI